MSIKEFWTERSAGGKDAVVAFLGGGAAIVLAYLAKADEGIVFAFGLIVIVTIGIIGILGWLKSRFS